jgi:hypothetical protein
LACTIDFVCAFVKQPHCSHQTVSKTNDAQLVIDSSIWNAMNLTTCYLTEQFRQNDDFFTEILNAIRDNNISEKVKEHLKSRFNKKPNLEAEPTKLYSHNIDVDFENERELAKIKGQTFEYKMMTEGRGKIVENLKKGCLAPEILRLKKGARVMFVKNNFEKGYANGTLGIVSDLSEYSIKVRTARGKVVEVERAKWIVEDGGKILAELDQYPLRLAWAITVHKSQGMSLDSAEIDLSQSFERGMGYVALSRVRSLDGLSLLGMNDMALKVSEEVLEFDKEFRAISERHRKELAMMENKEIAEAEKNFLAKVSGAKEEKKKKKNTVEETGKLFLAGKSLKEIVELRNITLGTVITHLEKIKEQNPYFNFSGIRDEMSAGKLNKIRSAFSKVGMSEGGYLLSPIKNALGPSVTFEEIRLVRLLL